MIKKLKRNCKRNTRMIAYERFIHRNGNYVVGFCSTRKRKRGKR
jgi:hypothetical protein